ncbi:L,D-transpeptidase family protein [Aureispira anguillae]|uniref:L,D-TPase catalytic domain-containing protein n=1 Tax=Aureispira anguillae TaxID=2864201 RepID=A0A915YHU8_9BACT|nr:hypothetical protein [Aureispira anguillae]BDS13282.1 hypothetical protein AsAng_0040120 [Aureispira anguillae]
MKTHSFLSLSFLMMILACQNTSITKEEPNNIIPIRSMVDSSGLSSNEALYGDLPDSVVAELKLMDSLLLALDQKEFPTEEDFVEDELTYEADQAAVDSINLENWEHRASNAFKQHQLSFERVQDIYKENATYIKKLLLSKGIQSFNIDFYMRAFKEEGVLELWAKPKERSTYTRLITYPFYQGMSTLGPKRREGDMQVPEGFYYIDYFNPESSYKISLRINYPNSADVIRNAEEAKIGGSICIHGHTISVGCLAITDLRIPNVYILAVEAKDKGQVQIPIHIFPARLEADKLATLASEWSHQTNVIHLWESMKPAYDYFEKTRTLAQIETTSNGFYAIQEQP